MQLVANCNLKTVDTAGNTLFETGTNPCTELEEAASVQNATPDFGLTYSDLDGDGDNELLLVVQHAVGGGYLIADPMGIAHLIANEQGSLDGYFDALSATQQAALLDQVEDSSANGAIEESELQSTIDGLNNLASDITYYAENFEYAAYEETVDVGHGYVSVTAGSVTYYIPEGDNVLFSTGEWSSSLISVTYSAGNVARVTVAAGTTYGGMSAAVGVILLLLASNVNTLRVAVVSVFLLMFGMAFGRSLGIYLDGGANAYMYGYLILELAACAIALLLLKVDRSQ